MNNYRSKLNQFLSAHDLAVRQIKQEEQSLADAEQQVADIQQAQQIVQGIAETVQQKAHEQIARVVTKCLESVFGEDAYEFRIQFEQKRGKTEAILCFVRDGKVIDDPISASGGGIVDVAAFALRLACLVLSQPKRRRFLACDEPFRFLSAEYVDTVREMLLTLSKDMGIQFLIVTHIKRLAAGTIIELEGE